MAQGQGLLKELTDKECEALDLVLDRLSSKEIAQRLGGLSPKTIDQRLDGARAKLGAATRVEAARRYASLIGMQERFPYQPFPLFNPSEDRPMSGGVPAGAVYTMGDAMTFRSSIPWSEATLDWGAPKFRGRAVGTVPLLVLILAGAALILAMVLLGLGVMQGLNAIVSG